MMIPTQLYFEPNQGKRIMTAYRKKKGCRIRARKGAAHRYHRGEMLLTPTQHTRYQNTANGETVSLPFTHEHLVKNMKHKGGFLHLIAAALAPVIGGIAGGLIEREIAGSGIYRKKSKKKKSTTGSGMYLSPYYNKIVGSGMYLNPYHKKGSWMYLNPFQLRK